MRADRRGVDMGPSAIRAANLNKRLPALGYHADDLGNVHVDQPESLPEGPARAKYLPQIALACKRLTMVDGAHEAQDIAGARSRSVRFRASCGGSGG